MPIFSPGYVHMGGPCPELYVCFSIRGRVEREEDKAHYWPVLSQVYEAISPLISGWQDVRFESDQALERRAGNQQNADGSFRTTLRKAPLGGLQKLNRERLEVSATRYLSDNAHLVDRFENGGKSHIRFFPPKGPERVHFFRTLIIGSRTRLRYDRSLDFGQIPHDFRLLIGDYAHPHAASRADPINQAIELYFWKPIALDAQIESLVRRIGAICGARHIWRAESGFMGEPCAGAQVYDTVRYSVFDTIEGAVEGANRYGSRWIDVLAQK
jgi:hypothetical protein